MTVRVLVVDDHPVVRGGVVGWLAAQPDIEVVGEAGDGLEALAAVAEHGPDVVLMDLRMPRLDGVAATERIAAAHPAVRVLVLTTYDTDADIVRAVEAGATGYLLKDAEPAALVDAVRAVASGRSPIDPRVARTYLSARRRSGTPRSSTQPELTDREREVLSLVGMGLANKQIARRLGIREGTVKAHLTNVFQRIGVRDRTAAALWAREHLGAL
jgi:DNA-binding NarL/FixJ family response regulator